MVFRDLLYCNFERPGCTAGLESEGSWCEG
jgi:hypothetical protein